MNGTLERSLGTIGIISPESLICASLNALISREKLWNISAEGSTIEDGLRLTASGTCSILIVNYELRFGNAADFLLELAHRHIRATVLILDRHWNKNVADQLRALGAKGLILTTSPATEMFKALDNVAQNGEYWPHNDAQYHSRPSIRSAPSLRKKIRILQHESGAPYDSHPSDHGQSSDPLLPLSAREREIFLLLASGMTNVGIAKKLFLSPRTVETHRARIVRKLGFNSNGQLIRFALRHGLAPL